MSAGRSIRQPGDRLGGFEVVELLGVGGTAVVYRARQLSLDRTVALKILDAGLADDDRARERFRREALHAASLEHPSIVPVYDAGEDDGAQFIAMRLIEGETLADRLRRWPLARDEALRILAAIAGALESAHAAGLVHRDVKPQNVLLGHGGEPYLADFGVARGGGEGLTQAGRFVGTVDYAAPEQILGEPLTPTTDVYALAILAFQCLTGDLPYPRETDAGVLHAHLTEPPPPLPGAGPASAVLARALAKDPAARPTAAAFVSELREALARTPETRAGPSAPPGRRGEHTIVDRPRPPGTRHAADAEARAVAAPEPPERSAAKAVPASAASTSATAAGAGEDARPGAHTVFDRPRPLAPLAADEGDQRRRGGWSLVGAAVIAIALPLGAWAIAPGGAARTHMLIAARGGLQLTYGGRWRTRPDDPGAFPKLALMGAATLIAKDGTILRAGALRDPVAPGGALPGAFARSVTGRQDASGVRLGTAPAVRHTGVLRASGRPLRAYVVVTVGGQDVIACALPRGATSASAGCDAVAASVVTPGRRVLAPGPDPALAIGLAKALKPVSSGRSATALSATDLGARAAAARRLAATDVTAAKALAALHPSTADAPTVRALQVALGRERRALTDLATAATRRDRARYIRAQSALTLADTTLHTALRTLAAHGYVVG